MKMPHEYRRTVEGRCKHCGAPITGLVTKKWCSNACKQQAKYARKIKLLRSKKHA